jgi:hypothetical protein
MNQMQKQRTITFVVVSFPKGERRKRLPGLVVLHIGAFFSSVVRQENNRSSIVVVVTGKEMGGISCS